MAAVYKSSRPHEGLSHCRSWNGSLEEKPAQIQGTSLPRVRKVLFDAMVEETKSRNEISAVMHSQELFPDPVGPEMRFSSPRLKKTVISTSWKACAWVPRVSGACFCVGGTLRNLRTCIQFFPSGDSIPSLDCDVGDGQRKVAFWQPKRSSNEPSGFEPLSFAADFQETQSGTSSSSRYFSIRRSER